MPGGRTPRRAEGPALGNDRRLPETGGRTTRTLGMLASFVMLFSRTAACHRSGGGLWPRPRRRWWPRGPACSAPQTTGLPPAEDIKKVAEEGHVYGVIVDSAAFGGLRSAPNDHSSNPHTLQKCAPFRVLTRPVLPARRSPWVGSPGRPIGFRSDGAWPFRRPEW
jgi:hypothetical protein